MENEDEGMKILKKVNSEKIETYTIFKAIVDEIQSLTKRLGGCINQINYIEEYKKSYNNYIKVTINVNSEVIDREIYPPANEVKEFVIAYYRNEIKRILEKIEQKEQELQAALDSRPPVG